jgi:hypothetical protein
MSDKIENAIKDWTEKRVGDLEKKVRTIVEKGEIKLIFRDDDMESIVRSMGYEVSRSVVGVWDETRVLYRIK